MTDELIYNPAGYRNMVRMSSLKYILVEGREDKRILTYLIREILGPNKEIKVHGAHQIHSMDIPNNREKVEEISDKIGKHKFADRFVGFVDRELREFELDSEITDILNKHNIINRLVWSRGHSIENYFFDFATLSRSLRDHSVTMYFEEALDLFGQNIEQIIREACTIGLAAWECKRLQPVRHSINDWNLIDFGPSGFVINMTRWTNSLVKKHNILAEEASALINSYGTWGPRVSRTNFNTIRWLCDGHTGIAFMWSTFARSVFEVSKKLGGSDPKREATNVLRADSIVRSNGCASEWVTRAAKKACEYPQDIFTLLGIT